MGEAGNAGHLNFDRHRYLALDLLGAPPRPLRDDLYVIVGYVGVGLNGKSPKRDDAPRGQYHHPAQHKPAVLQPEIDERTNQFRIPAMQGQEYNPYASRSNSAAPRSHTQLSNVTANEDTPGR